MNSRERVLLAINHEEADRLPMFRPNMIQTYEPLNEGVQNFLDTFKFDRFAGVGFIKGRPEERRKLSDDVFEDSYGCRFKYMGVGLPYCIHSPLAHVRTVEDVERFRWPDVDNFGLIAEDARQRAREIHEKGEYATAVGVGMLFHRYHYMRGFEQWLIDMAANPEIHRAIADRIHHINSTLALRILDEVGEYTDIVTFGDDFGTSTDSYMSPADFRAMVKPYFKSLMGRIKDRFPNIKIYLHSHGQIMGLIPDLIDCGIDILNPILPLDNMDPVVLKRDFGDQLAFEGGIDIEHILPFGTLDEVKDHVKEVIDILAPGGGFIFKAQAISNVIPYENLAATYNLALRRGRYDSHV